MIQIFSLSIKGRYHPGLRAGSHAESFPSDASYFRNFAFCDAATVRCGLCTTGCAKHPATIKRMEQEMRLNSAVSIKSSNRGKIPDLLVWRSQPLAMIAD